MPEDSVLGLLRSGCLAVETDGKMLRVSWSLEEAPADVDAIDDDDVGLCVEGAAPAVIDVSIEVLGGAPVV